VELSSARHHELLLTHFKSRTRSHLYRTTLRGTALSRWQHRFESGRGRQAALNAAERLKSAELLGFPSLWWYKTGVQNVAAMTYLVRHPKTGVYYFRRAVPHDLRTTIGKTTIKKSLGTKDVSEGKRRAHSVATGVEAEFERARKLLGASPLSELSDAEIERLAAMYLHALLEEDDAARIHGTEGDDDLYRTVRAQVLATGGAARWSDDDATGNVGLSNRAYAKMAETFDIVLPGLREKLARGDTTIVADEVDAFPRTARDQSGQGFSRIQEAVLCVPAGFREGDRGDGEAPPGRAGRDASCASLASHRWCHGACSGRLGPPEHVRQVARRAEASAKDGA
jgi:uncharacterized protein DUF6538